MNRQIKFRVWTGAKMDYDIMAGGLGAFYVAGIDPKDSASMSSANTIYSKQCPLMQFTGLCDKNGKEIYEGDIVRMGSWEPKEMQIAFIEGAFCLANKAGEFVGDIHYIQHGGVNQSEILGNIYENPSLLPKDN